MTDYVLHMHNHAGWYTQHIQANTLAEAIDKGLKLRAAFLSEEYAGQYRIEHDAPSSPYPRYRVYWDSNDPKTFPLGQPSLKRGDLWWGDRFEVGTVDDCTSCGGTGVNHYNPFNQCWHCGDADAHGKGTGKQPLDVQA